MQRLALYVFDPFSIFAFFLVNFYSHGSFKLNSAEKLQQNIHYFQQQVEEFQLTSRFIKSKSSIQSCLIPGNEEVKNIAEALQQLPRPLLAFCRSGKRATHLWAYAKRQHEQCDLAELFAAAHAAGVDLEDQRHGLERSAQ